MYSSKNIDAPSPASFMFPPIQVNFQTLPPTPMVAPMVDSAPQTFQGCRSNSHLSRSAQRDQCRNHVLRRAESMAR